MICDARHTDHGWEIFLPTASGDRWVPLKEAVLFDVPEGRFNIQMSVQLFHKMQRILEKAAAGKR